MKKNKDVTKHALAALVLVSIMAAPLAASAGPPSLSTNPGNHVIFPAKGQTPEQQKQDESDAYDRGCRRQLPGAVRTVG